MKGRESVLNYSQSEMNFMRQDALRRTREMHRQNRIDKNNVQAAKNAGFPYSRACVGTG